MRNVLIVVILLIVSCGPETEMDKAIYSIKNESEVVVKLNFIDDVLESNNRSVTLEPNDSFTGEELETGNGGYLSSSESNAPAVSLGTVAIEIVFDNQSEFEFEFDASISPILFSEPINRNPLRVGSYDMLNEENYQYTITQEDYNNAIPCDGPCE